MSKGLARSLDRGPRGKIVNKHVPISGSMDITGVAVAVDAGTFVIEGLDQGNLLLLGAVAYVEVDAGVDADVLDTWAGDYGIGSIPNADLDLADPGDDDIIPSTPLLAGGADKLSPRARATSTEAVEQGVILDNTDGSLELNFNLLIDDNFITDAAVGTFAVTGDLFLAYVILGDD